MKLQKVAQCLLYTDTIVAYLRAAEFVTLPIWAVQCKEKQYDETGLSNH